MLITLSLGNRIRLAHYARRTGTRYRPQHAAVTPRPLVRYATSCRLLPENLVVSLVPSGNFAIPIRYSKAEAERWIFEKTRKLEGGLDDGESWEVNR